MEGTTIKERIRSVDAGGFSDEIDRVWQATDRIKDVVVEQVSGGYLQPADGLEILGCVASRAFGHSTPTSTDLLSALQPQR